jgi:hypothetical protein
MIMSPGPRGRNERCRRRLARPLAVLVSCIGGLAGAPAEAAEANPVPRDAAAPKRVIVDHAVTPAGGRRTAACPSGQCRHGHRHGHAHRPECRDGHCVPSCPVRPGHYGFYGTQWRRWPNQGVVPVSAEEAATPVRPPKSAVPGADEESPRRPSDDLPRPAGTGSDGEGAVGPADAAGDPNAKPAPREAAVVPRGPDAAPDAEPDSAPRGPEPPDPPQPAKSDAGNESLFEGTDFKGTDAVRPPGISLPDDVPDPRAASADRRAGLPGRPSAQRLAASVLGR